MAISTNGTVLARLAGALYNTQMSNATYSEVKTLDPATLADALYARDFSASTDATVATTLVTNLGLSSITGLNNWVAAQLTAAGSHKGAKIVDLLNGFAQMTADATYGAAATAFNTVVDAALVLSQTTGNAGGTFAAAGVVVVTGATFTLTTSVDSITGTAGNDTFTGNNSTNAATALTALDSINGGAGNDTLNIVVTAAIDQTATSYTVTGIETANLSATGTVAATTTAWTGLTALNVSGTDDLTITAATTTAITASASTQSVGSTINGGSTVVLVAADASTLGTATGDTINVGGTTAAKGAVTVSYTETVADAAGANQSTGTAINVTGGTTVSVSSLATVAASNTALDVFTTGAVGVTGTADTTSVTVNQSKAVTRAASTIGIVNGGVTIADVNAADATKAGSIASVSLTNFGDSTVNSSALTSVTLGGTGGTFGIGRGALTAVPTANTLALNTNTLTGTNTITDTEAGADADDGFTTINLTNTGTTVIADLVAADLTTLNIAGSGSLTLTANTLGGALTTSVVSTSTGSVKLSGALAVAANYTGAEGVDTVTAGAAATGSINTNAGDDVITVSTLGTAGRINAGDGTDTLVMAAADAATASAAATFIAKVTGVERLSLGAYADAAGVTVNLVNMNGINHVTSAGGVTGGAARAQAISGFTTGGTFNQTALFNTNQNVTLSGTTFSAGAADVFNLGMTGTDGYANVGVLTLADVETLAITTTDSDTTAATTAFDANIDATSVKTVTVTGNAGMTFANSDLGTALTSFNASGVTVGPVTYTTAALAAAATITGGAGDDTLSGASAAVAGVTISGGAGNDTITGSATKASTLNGDAGNDSITGGSAADVIDGGAGTNTYVFSSANVVEQAGSGTTSGAVINLSAAAITSTAVFTATGAYLSNLATGVAAGASTYLFNNESNTNVSVVDTLANIQNATGTDLADYIVGSDAANVITGGTGADVMTGGAGADTFAFVAGATGTPSATNFDTITDYVTGTDKIDFTAGNLALVAEGTIGVAQAAISATGFATFNAADDTLAERIVAVEAAMTAATAVARETAVFAFGANSYVFVSDGTAGVGANDVLIKLTGIVAATGITLTSGDITAIA